MEGSLFPQLPEAERDEEMLAAAFDYIGEPSGEYNTFIVGGYKGTRLILSALAEGAGDRASLRAAVERALEKRAHEYIEFVSGPGIPFFTVRDERFEAFMSQR